MPQMAPLSWAPLMMIITLALMLISTALFWGSKTTQQTESKKMKETKMNWKW